MEQPRPRLVISRCIEFDRVRYNGEMISSDLVRALIPRVEAIPVCPEVEVGLSVPRESLRLVAVDGDVRLLQPATGRDLTDAMREWAERFLGALPEVDGFVLKSRSPSSGLRDVKLYRAVDGPIVLGSRNPGLFGAAVLARYGSLAIEDEARLENPRIREHFLTKLYAIARLRALGARPRMRDLVSFQSANKLLLMAYSQKELRAMGNIVANREGLDARDVLAAYRAHLLSAMPRAAAHRSHINVLTHAAGYFKEGLSKEEKDLFARTLDDYRAGRVPWSVPSSLVRSWAVRFKEGYLLQQTYLDPFPAELAVMRSPAEERDYWR